MSGSKGPGPHLTSEDVNYMVYRYLQESGFQHTAFSFAHESNIHKTELDPNTVPPGALVTFVQRGMQYLEMEANLDIQENDITTEYQILGPQDLMTKDIDELRQLVLDKKEERKEKQERQQKPKKERKQKQEQQDKQERQQERQERQQQEKQERQQKQEKQEAERADAMEVDDKHVEITHVTTFAGHSSEVFICAWSPTEPLLASGSGDATARIWNVSMGDSQVPMVCDHNIDASQNNSRSKDVTTLDWSPDGELLATGCYDGWARVFSKTGELVRVLKKHTGPIFSLKWNKKGTCLLSGSVDRTAILWDAKSGEVQQQWQLHNAPTLDVDWKDNSTFATCSTDHMIYVCRLGTPDPVQVFKGQQDEVNAIKWDPSGNLLASCSDDCTIRLWSMNQDKPVHHLKLHSKEIYTIKWAPAGPGSANPDRPLVLASASFDSTVKIWDPETGQCKFNLRQHTEPVYSVGFSPDGRWLATGSFDKKMHIWSVDDGQLVKSYQGDGGIFEVAWNREGDKVAACFSNKTVCVVDLRFG